MTGVRERLTLHFISVTTSEKWQQDEARVDVTDMLINAAPQFGRPLGAEVGADRITVTKTENGTWWGEAEAELPDGRISCAGPIVRSVDDSMRLPITGGSGRYENASGELLVGPGGDRAENTYALDLPSAAG